MEAIINVSSPPNRSIPKPPAPPMLDVNDLVMRVRSIWKEDFMEHQEKVNDIIKGMKDVNEKINTIESRLTEIESRARDTEEEQERVTSGFNEALNRVNGFEAIMVDSEQATTSVLSDHTERLNELDTRAMNDNHRFDMIEANIANLTDGTVINQLLTRITELEARLGPPGTSNEVASGSSPITLTANEVRRLRKREQDLSDSYYLHTILFTQYGERHETNNPRNTLRSILRTIGSEDIMGTINEVKLFAGGLKIRATFNSLPDLHEAYSYMARCMNHATRDNRSPPFRFTMMTPQGLT